MAPNRHPSKHHAAPRGCQDPGKKTWRIHPLPVPDASAISMHKDPAPCAGSYWPTAFAPDQPATRIARQLHSNVPDSTMQGTTLNGSQQFGPVSLHGQRLWPSGSAPSPTHGLGVHPLKAPSQARRQVFAQSTAIYPPSALRPPHAAMANGAWPSAPNEQQQQNQGKEAYEWS